MNTTFEQISIIGAEQTQAAQRHTQVPASAMLRLRERMMSERGFETFDDAEILSTILSYAPGTKDTTDLVARLMDNFGSLKAILEARPEQLLRVDGMNKTRAGLITMMIPMARVWIRSANDTGNVIRDTLDAKEFCKSLLIGERNELFYVIALSAQNKILGYRRISSGSLSEVTAYPRLVLETALNYNALSVILCHNHPGGFLGPSPEDIDSTTQLQNLLYRIGIMLLDHIIVAGDKGYSMMKHGDVDYRHR